MERADMASVQTTPLVSNDLLSYLPSFERHLRARNRAAATIRIYTKDVRLFAAWLVEKGASTNIEAIDRGLIEMHLDELSQRAAGNTVAARYQGLRRFFNWLVDDDELDRSPMEKVGRPMVPDDPETHVLTPDEQRRLLDACKGRDFAQRRDLALLAVALDAGLRCGELAGLAVEDWDDPSGTLVVTKGKGRRRRVVRLGARAAEALSKYVRVRARHRDAHLPNMWLGTKGGLGDRGINQMVRRRGIEVGLPWLHPHALRHTFASTSLSNGASEGDLMTLGGWRSADIMRRYGRAAATERALAAHQKFSPLDSL